MDSKLWPWMPWFMALGLCLLAWCIKRVRSTTQPHVPGLPFPFHLHQPLLGVAMQLKDMIAGLQVLCVDHANEDGMSSFKLMGKPIVSVLRADHARLVLLASNYRSPVPLWGKHMDAFLGPKALVSLMHSEWKVHRRLIGRGFQWQNLVGMVPDMCVVAHAFTARLVSECAGGAAIDVFPEIKLATLDAIGLTALGYRFNAVAEGGNAVAAAFEYLLDETSRRQGNGLFEPSSLCSWLPTAANQRINRGAHHVHLLVEARI